jgi:hypothetical protein
LNGDLGSGHVFILDYTGKVWADPPNALLSVLNKVDTKPSSYETLIIVFEL